MTAGFLGCQQWRDLQLLRENQFEAFVDGRISILVETPELVLSEKTVDQVASR